jgi:hypothetical protein
MKGAELGRDATRRDLVRLLAGLADLPTGALGQPWADVAADDPDGQAAREAVRLRLLLRQGGQMALDRPVNARAAQTAVARALGWDDALLKLARITDASGARIPTPPGFAPAVVAREGKLRRNYPSPDDGLERPDWAPMRLADLLYMAGRGADIMQEGTPEAVRALEQFAIPALDPATRPVVERALAQVGQPYVWGGEWPDPRSPLDPQAAGGFDCSGLVWFAYRSGAGAKQTGLQVPDGRTTYTMAQGRRGKVVPLALMQATDLVFFGDRGRRTPNNAVSHVAMSLGGGWVIQSSGSRAGVTVSYLPAYWPEGMQGARTYRPGAGAAPVAPVTPVTPTAPVTPTTPTAPPTTTAVPVTPAVPAPVPGAPPQPVIPAPGTTPAVPPPPG